MTNTRPYNDMEDHEGDTWATRFFRGLTKLFIFLFIIAYATNPERPTDKQWLQDLKNIRGSVQGLFWEPDPSVPIYTKIVPKGNYS